MPLLRQILIHRELTFVSLLLLLLCGCTGREHNNTASRKAKGAVKYGGVFHINETEYFRSLFPQNITETVGHRVTNQVYEGLLRLDQASLAVMPCLASSWVVSDSARLFTFTIRHGVYFHDDACFPSGKGRQMTALDVQYCLDKLCQPSPVNQGFWLFKDVVVGATAYFAAREHGDTSVAHVPGISVPNDSTIVIQLVRPFAGFLYRLAMPYTAIFPREAIAHYGIDMRERCVGTGPFHIKRLLPDVAVYLERNDTYWGRDSMGNTLPYLDGIRWSFIKAEKVEMIEFRKGKLDMKYRLPLDMVREVIDTAGLLLPDYKQYQLQTVPELSTQFYGLLHTDKVFSNVHVRRAFNYAIDRKRIITYTLKGEGVASNGCIVPRGMAGFHQEQIKGYDYNPEKARQELALAGYPDGRGFPDITLQINSGGGRNEKVAEAIANQIEKSLGITVHIAQSLWAQHTENAEMGRYQFWRFGWVADYPDPENFLNLYYGKNVPAPTERSYLNSSRYSNPAFDKVFELALSTADFDQRNRLYEQAAQIGVDDAVTLNIFYSLNRRLLQPWVRQYPANGMEYRSLREVWMDR
jgi:oligopeptide transport system substrate-binding protein